MVRKKKITSKDSYSGMVLNDRWLQHCNESTAILLKPIYVALIEICYQDQFGNHDNQREPCWRFIDVIVYTLLVKLQYNKRLDWNKNEKRILMNWSKWNNDNAINLQTWPIGGVHSLSHIQISGCFDLTGDSCFKIHPVIWKAFLFKSMICNDWYLSNKWKSSKAVSVKWLNKIAYPLTTTSLLRKIISCM